MTQSYFKQVPNLEYVNRTKGNKDISNYITVKNLFKRGRIRPDIFGNVNYFTKYKVIGDDRPDNVANEVYGNPNLDWVILLSNNIQNIQTEWPLPQTSLDEFFLEKYRSYEELNSIHHYETIELKNSQGGVILPGGLETPNKWKTNGNYIQAINTTINQISGTESKIATVTMYNGIKNLEVGSEVYIQGVSEDTYNGRFPVTSILAVGDVVIKFTYVLPSIPEKKTIINYSGGEEVTFTVEGNVGTGNAYYYEYYDNNSYHTVPAAKMTEAVTNYQYEMKKEDDKRNIFTLKPEYLNVIFNDMDEIMPYKKGASQYVSDTLKKGENIRLYN